MATIVPAPLGAVTSPNPALEELTGPGGMFEIVVEDVLGVPLQVYKQPPGASEVLVTTISPDAPPSLGGRDPSRTGNFSFTDPSPGPTGTRYRVVVVDPLNRLGAPAALTV